MGKRAWFSSLIVGLSLSLGVQMFGGAARAETAPPAPGDDTIVSTVSSLKLDSSLPLSVLNLPSSSLALNLPSGLDLSVDQQDPIISVAGASESTGAAREPGRPGDLTPCMQEGTLIPYAAASWFVHEDDALCGDLNAVEDDAVASVIRSYGLADDPTYARAAARAEIRAEVMRRLLAAAVKAPNASGVPADATHRSAAEQRIVDWLEGVEQKYRLASAKASLAEFEKFAADGGKGSCDYKPPAPHSDDYPGQGGRWFGCFTRNAVSSFFNLGPSYPDQSQWTKWGMAAATSELPTTRAAAIGASFANSLLAGLAVTATYAAAQVGWNVLLQTSRIAMGYFARAVVPYAVREALKVAGILAAKELTKEAATVATKAVSGLVGPVAVIVGIALTLAIATGEYVTKGPRVREELTKAIEAAQQPVDIRSALSDPDQDEATILNFLVTNWMALQPVADPALPAALPRTYNDGVLTVDGRRTLDPVKVAGWDGTAQSVELRGGYFVVDGKPTLSLNYLDASGEKRTGYRLRISGEGQPARYAFTSMKSDDTAATCSVGEDGAITGSCSVGTSLQVRGAGLGSLDASTFSLGWAPNTAPVRGLLTSGAQQSGVATLALTSATDAEGDPIALRWEIERRPYGRRDLTDPCPAGAARDGLPAGSCWETIARTLKATTTLPTSGSYRWRLTVDDGVAPQLVTGTVRLDNRRPQVRRGGACGAAGSEPAACIVNQAVGGQPITYGVSFVEPDASDPTDVTLTWSDGTVWRTSYRDACDASDPVRCNGNVFDGGDATWTSQGSVRYLLVRRTFPDFAGPSLTVSATDGTATVTDQQAFSIRPKPVVPPAPPVVPPPDYLALAKVTTGKPLTLIRTAVGVERSIEAVDTGTPVQVRGVLDRKGDQPATVTVDWGDGTAPQQVTVPCPGTCPRGLDVASTGTGGLAFGLTRTYDDPRTGTATVTVRSTTQGPFTASAGYQVVRPPLAVKGLVAGVPLANLADFTVGGGGSSSIEEGKQLEVRGAVDGVAAGDRVALDVDWGDRVDSVTLPCADCGVESTYLAGRRVFSVKRFFGAAVSAGRVGVQASLLDDQGASLQTGAPVAAPFTVLDTPSLLFPEDLRIEPQCGDAACPLVENKRVKVHGLVFDWGYANEIEVLVKDADGPGSVQIVPARVRPGFDPANVQDGAPVFDFEFDLVPRAEPPNLVNFPFNQRTAMNYKIAVRPAKGLTNLDGVDALFATTRFPRPYDRITLPVDQLTGAAPSIDSVRLTAPPGSGRGALPLDGDGRALVRDGVLGVGAEMSATGDNIDLATAQAWVDQPADTPPRLLTGLLALQGVDGKKSGVAAGLLDVSALKEGEHTITIAARDQADRLTATTRRFVVDRTAPVVRAPRPGSVGAPGSRLAVDQFVGAGEASSFTFVRPTAVDAGDLASANDEGTGGTPVPMDCGPTTRALTERATLVGCTATDPAGNQARYAFTVQVADAVGLSPIVVTPGPVLAGGQVRLSTAVSGEPAPEVMWQRRSSPDDGWQDVGATGDSYSFTASLGDDGAQFRAVGTNGFATGATDPVGVQVSTLPEVVSGPVDTVAMDGNAADFSVEVAGSPAPDVTWEQSTDRGRTWVARTTTSSSTLRVIAGSQLDGALLRAVVTNRAGTVRSQPARLSVSRLLRAPARAAATSGDGRLVIAWSPPSVANRPLPITGYVVHRLDERGQATPVCRVDAVAGDPLRCVVDGLANGLRYRFTIAAVNAAGVGRSTTVAGVPFRPVTFTDQPPAEVSVRAGVPLGLSATVDADPAPSLRWQVSSDGGTTWRNAGAAVNGLRASLDDRAQLARSGWRYRLKVAHLGGTSYSRVVTVTVTR